MYNVEWLYMFTCPLYCILACPVGSPKYCMTHKNKQSYYITLITCEYKNISNMSKTNNNSSSWVKPLLNWTCTFLFTLQNIKSSFKERATQCSHLKRQLFWKWVICHLNHFSLQDNHSKITSDLFRSEGHHFQMVHPVWIWRGGVGHRKCVEMHIPTPTPPGKSYSMHCFIQV